MPAKPILHPLQTPRTMTFPSELQADSGASLSGGGARNSSDDGLSTPITPPAAYTEFLKALTPIFSPADGNGATTRFVWDKATKTPTSQPASAVSGSFNFSDATTRPATASLPPPTPYGTVPPTRRDMMNLRRLRIPPAMRYSPTLETPRSANSILSPYSPSDWKLRYWEGPRSATASRVSVRHVVTHTVTYKRTQLEDPPKGKRRKHSEEKDES
ncbi:hypothetical protein BO86DRAFT_385884 [Aspergillus japonicus CBS 114.51]|uniref:Uncharacterized protein n=2 Tax=Aspergillus TaxID=5052 RepID=A0A2V5GVX2_ASPV1|nr:hypothetical protein BO86DRAFT_385884 [Aspergillus japonicus CBS 114.51]PYI15418.1 hypothetical protein BO99DRAFT_253904 [Aspergillus violaceofuscus CBS 115571]RAH85591.1 hypothetical protein BO86DRAFT_385884 [Aspergillus japonicus CBS 114.51]